LLQHATDRLRPQTEKVLSCSFQGSEAKFMQKKESWNLCASGGSVLEAGEILGVRKI
jgi:hypothetical protein